MTCAHGFDLGLFLSLDLSPTSPASVANAPFFSSLFSTAAFSSASSSGASRATSAPPRITGFFVFVLQSLGLILPVRQVRVTRLGLHNIYKEWHKVPVYHSSLLTYASIV